MAGDPRIAQMRQTIQDLRMRLQQTADSKMTGGLPDSQAPQRRVENSLRERQRLTGHYGKVYALHWAGDSLHMVTASQDGKLMVWNGLTTNKVQAIPLRTCWVMTCSFEQVESRFVACGGLENLVSVYQLGQPQVSRPSRELVGHDGYLSCARFFDSGTIVSASGDSTCLLWDVERGETTVTFDDHSGDVMSVAISPGKNLIASGSVDATAKIWDVRSGECTHTFTGHGSDINSVDFFPDGQAIGTGSDDSTCRLFDLRCHGEVNQFVNNSILCGITSVSFSRSGRIVFAGYDDNLCAGWDTARGDGMPVHELREHTARVSCLGVNPSGQALATASWDCTIIVHA